MTYARPLFLCDIDAASKPIRWTAQRKEALLTAIRRGELSEADACERYDLSAEELVIWRDRFAFAGRKGLAVTKIQQVTHG